MCETYAGGPTDRQLEYLEALVDRLWAAGFHERARWYARRVDGLEDVASASELIDELIDELKAARWSS